MRDYPEPAILRGCEPEHRLRVQDKTFRPTHRELSSRDPRSAVRRNTGGFIYITILRTPGSLCALYSAGYGDKGIADESCSLLAACSLNLERRISTLAHFDVDRSIEDTQDEFLE